MYAKLNNKKSGDEFGISAEHFKLAGQSIVAALLSRTIQCHFRTRLHPTTISIRDYNTSIQKRT
jgi:hypothetical protein